MDLWPQTVSIRDFATICHLKEIYESLGVYEPPQYIGLALVSRPDNATLFLISGPGVKILFMNSSY